MKERQKKLYEYLIKKGEIWTPQSEVARELFLYYGNGECFIEPRDYHSTAERRLLTDDIREINCSTDFEKIIIASGKGIKIASEAEFNRYIKAQYDATIRKLSRIYKAAKKGNRHGQIDFGGHTVESFLENLPETT
jgi:hypothetical protein